MKNFPVKKEIQNLLGTNPIYRGVLEIRTKEKYLKLASDLNHPVVRISKSGYRKPKFAVKAVETCAKVYKRLIQEGLYHPKTRVVICEDEISNLTLLVLMPKLDCYKNDHAKISEKIEDLEKRLGFDLDEDLSSCYFNWGYDKVTKEYYAHDLHVIKTDNSYKELLKIAKRMRIK